MSLNEKLDLTNCSYDYEPSYDVNFEKNLKKIDWLSCTKLTNGRPWKIFMAISDYQNDLPLVRLLDFGTSMGIGRKGPNAEHEKVYYGAPKDVILRLIFV